MSRRHAAHDQRGTGLDEDAAGWKQLYPWRGGGGGCGGGCGCGCGPRVGYPNPMAMVAIVAAAMVAIGCTANGDDEA